MTDQKASQKPDRQRLPAPVYHVESETDPTVLVAINVWLSGQSISWFDTVKERLMHGEILEETPAKFVFRRDPQAGGQTYTFVPMTLEIYRSAIRGRLAGGRDFDDEQAMVEAFLQSFKNAW